MRAHKDSHEMVTGEQPFQVESREEFKPGGCETKLEGAKQNKSLISVS